MNQCRVCTTGNAVPFLSVEGKDYWRCRREPTHVVFHREETFYRIASDFGWMCEIPQKDILLMRKPLG